MAGRGVRAGPGPKPTSEKALSAAVSKKAASSKISSAPAPAYGQGSMWQHFGPSEATAAKTILAAAHAVEGEGNWHGKKVFISALYDKLHGSQKMPRDSFKAGLVELHQKGLLRLSRADLVEAMPRLMVRGSETSHQNATFHFVRIDGEG